MATAPTSDSIVTPWLRLQRARNLTDCQQPRPYSNLGYLQNGASGLQPGTAPLLPNQGRIIQTGPIRVLCIADVRGLWRRRPRFPARASKAAVVGLGLKRLNLQET